MDFFNLYEQVASQRWTIAITTLIILVVYAWGIAPFRVLKNAFGDKVPGPTALPFIGNMLDAIRHKGQMHLQIEDYRKRYGDLFGMYLLGSVPCLVISDLDMIKQVYVKDFQAFHDRAPTKLRFPEPFNKMLNHAEGEDWRRIRNTLSPTFSAHKMKQMVPLMNSACDTLMKRLEQVSKTRESFDVVKYHQGLTMDVILLCAFGIQADSQNNPNEPAIIAAKRAINGSAPQRIILTVLTLIPFGRKIIELFPSLLTRDLMDLMDISEQIVAAKNSTGSISPRKDLLDLMLAAADPSLSDSKKMTVDEVLAQSIIFLFAGYETSSNALGFVCYHLATNPDVQEKLQKEIDSVWDDESKMPSYETVNELPYLDMVISETLRLYPPAPFNIRLCTEDCMLKSLKVPQGISVVIPTYSIHRDARLWPNPERFDPDRFTPEAKQSRDPYAFMPFGHGPRNCIGMRFAQMEIKLVLARMLKKFSFQVAADTKIPPEVTLRATMAAKEIKLKIMPRS